jgi:flagellar basal body-associated protein FliL
MKKVMSIIVVLQIVFLALGYGVGTYLEKSDQMEGATSTDSGSSDETAAGNGHGEKVDSKPIIVKLGQMVIPVYKPRSVTYVVINLGISVADLKTAEHYNIGENGVRLRDDIFAALKQTADGNFMRGAVIDTENLSKSITKNVKKKFANINDVLFLDFYKKDIARS